MACHVHEEVKRAAIGVVQVFEDQQQRLSSADVAQAVEYSPEQPQSIILWALGRAQLNLEPASEVWYQARDLACVRAEVRAQCFGVALASESFEGFDERLIRDADGALWIAMADKYASVARADEARQLRAEGRLADTWLADEHDQPAITTTGDRLKCSPQLAQFALTANERLLLRQACSSQLLLGGLSGSLWACVPSHGRYRAL
jgi:hypothetical protein